MRLPSMTEHETPTFNLPRPRPSRPNFRGESFFEPKLTSEQVALESEFDQVWGNFYDYFMGSPLKDSFPQKNLTGPVFKSLFEDCIEVSKRCRDVLLFKKYDSSFFVRDFIEVKKCYDNYLFHIARKDPDNPIHDIELMRLSNYYLFKEILYQAVTFAEPGNPYQGDRDYNDLLKKVWRPLYNSQWRDELCKGHRVDAPHFSSHLFSSVYLGVVETD